MSTGGAVRVTAVTAYPVKSLGGVSLTQAVVQPWGLRHDRRWALVDAKSEKVTAREEHALLGLRAEPLDDGGLSLSAPGRDPLEVTPPHGAEPVVVHFSGQSTALPAGAAADAWVSAAVGRELRLVWQGEESARPVRPEMGGEPGDVNSLSDAGPVHVTSEASLAVLNEWLGETARERGEAPPQTMGHDRFRPNVVVSGGEPFAEDEWDSIRVGDVSFRTTMICDRCVMTTIERSDLRGGKEPIRTLARPRRWDGATWFGVRLTPMLPVVDGAMIRVGDEVVRQP